VAIVPGKVDQRQKWDPGYGSRILDRYVGLTRQAMAQHPDLVVWPETALPFAFEQSAGRRARIERLVREFRVPLLLGTIAAERRSGRRLRRNRVYALAADGAVSGTYDKQVLVPFGEYVPFGSAIPFARPIVGGSVPIVAGARQGPLAIGPARVGVLICYESLLPHLARRHAAAGATLLAVLSNDGWYAGSAAPVQLAADAVFRAVETRLPLVRVANDGPSLLVDAAGRVVWRADGNGASWGVVVVPAAAQVAFPHGEALVIVACVLATIAALVRPGRLGPDDA
jgi:apolipoprotein N-acyltransferase